MFSILRFVMKKNGTGCHLNIMPILELPRPVEDGDSQTKKILDISLEFFLLHRRPDDL